MQFLTPKQPSIVSTVEADHHKPLRTVPDNMKCSRCTSCESVFLPDIPLSGLKFRQRTGALLDLYFDLLLSRFLGFGE